MVPLKRRRRRTPNAPAPTRLVAVLVAALSLAGAGARPARGATIGVDLYGLSHHFARRTVEGYRFNETNWGGGVDWLVNRTPSQTVFADLSLFDDSFRNSNRYLAIGWTHRIVGHLQAGGMLAISSSYSILLGEPFMAPIPMLSYRTDRAALQFTFLPPAQSFSAYPSIDAFATVYPFGPGRVRPPHTAADSAQELGLELTVAPRLVLERFAQATLALRSSDGARGWRLGLDLGAAIGDSTHRGTGLDATHRRDQTFGVLMRAERLWSGPSRRGIAPLVGVGPLLGYSNHDPEWELRTWRLGVTGGVGIEWRVAPSLSVLAESAWDFVATFGREEYDDSQNGFLELERRRIALESRGVRLGVTAWRRGRM